MLMLGKMVGRGNLYGKKRKLCVTVPGSIKSEVGSAKDDQTDSLREGIPRGEGVGGEWREERREAGRNNGEWGG